MADTRGIFSLREIKEEKDLGLGVDINSVFIVPESETSSNFGYCGGGANVSNDQVTTMQKVNFAEDTTALAPGADLISARYLFATLGSSTAGYFTSANPEISNTDKVTYSTDTCAYTPSANLATTRNRMGGVSNSTHGYWSGGWPGPQTTADKLTFATDTTASFPAAQLSLARRGLRGVGNQSSGYFCGGVDTPGPQSTTDKLVYATETISNVTPANLTITRWGLGGCGDSSFAYLSGGIAPGHTSATEKLEYSTDSIARESTADLTGGRYGVASSGNSTNGYVMGGPGPQSTTDKIVYATDTTTRASGADLVTPVRLAASSSARNDALPSTITFPIQQWTTGTEFGPDVGYFAGGTPVNLSYIQKSDFSSETTSTIPATISIGRAYIAQASTAQNGYFTGGLAGSTKYSRTDKLTYSTDTSSALPSSGNLSASVYGCSGASSLNDGYIAGGATPSPVSTMVKIQFADDTTATAPNITEQKAYMQSLSDLTNVYQIGGWSGSTSHSSVDRVVTSSDTVTRIPTADLTHAIHGCYGIGYSDAGYLRGGYEAASITYTQKVTYSTETSSVVPGAPMEWNSHYHTAAGNNTYGYTTGGGTTTSVSKLNYSTETSSVNTAQNIEHGAGGMGGTGARNFGRTQPPQPTPTPQTAPVSGPTPNTGYFGGGLDSSSTRRSTMDKLTYSNDTTAEVPGAPLSSAKSYTGATGNGTAGYFGGGKIPATLSTMDKITYSSDTLVATPSANLSVARYALGGVGDENSGYFGGGDMPGTVSTVDKCTYTTDTTAQVPGASLSNVRFRLAATGNSDAGYFGSGHPGPLSTVDKLTYSSDTTAQVPGASLSVPRHSVAATGNSTRGYFGGGRNAGGDHFSTVDKLTYSNDTTAEVPGAVLSGPRADFSATGNSSSGYFGGGLVWPNMYSTMDKLTYADETTAEVPGAALSLARYGVSATSSKANALPSTAFTPSPVIC